MISASTGSRAVAFTNAGRPASCASSPRNAPGPISDNWGALARRVLARDVNLAREDDAQAAWYLADLGKLFGGRKRPNFAEPPDALDF
jgi:hypothetical protein